MIQGARYTFEFCSKEKLTSVCMVNKMTEDYVDIVADSHTCDYIKKSCKLPCVVSLNMLRLYLKSRLMLISLDTSPDHREVVRGWSWNYAFREEARIAARMFLLCANRVKLFDKFLKHYIAIRIRETFREPCWISVHHARLKGKLQVP
jgi:hypothetical protein